MAHEYDPAERDLERAGMTLSRHPSEAGVDWRLTLPHGEQLEAWEPGTAGLAPPPEITRFIKSDFMHKRLASQGARAIGSSREEFAAFMRAEQDKWGKVLNEIQIKPE